MKPYEKERSDRIFKCANTDELRKLIVDNKQLIGLSCDELVKRQYNVDENDLQWVVKECEPTKVMREYLMKYPPRKDSLSWMIRNARIPLSRKATLFDYLCDCEDLPAELCLEAKRFSESNITDRHYFDWRLESIAYDSFHRQYWDIKDALQELNLEQEEILTLTWYDFDEDYMETLEIDDHPFSSFEDAVEYIRWLMAYEQIDKDRLSWFMLSKWIPNEAGQLRRSYRYVLMQDEVIYFERPRIDEDRWGSSLKDSIRYFGSGLAYNDWPGLPFRNGDLFTIDFRPFAPPVHALMVDDRSCFIEDGDLREEKDFDPRSMNSFPGTLRREPMSIVWDSEHRQCSARANWSLSGSQNVINDQCLPPFFTMPYERLDVCTPQELAEDEKMLLEVQKFIREDPKRGELLFHLPYDTDKPIDTSTDAGLRTLLDRASARLEEHSEGGE